LRVGKVIAKTAVCSFLAHPLHHAVTPSNFDFL